MKDATLHILVGVALERGGMGVSVGRGVGVRVEVCRYYFVPRGGGGLVVCW